MREKRRGEKEREREMDKNRDVRRVFSPQSGPNKKKPHLLISGNVEKEKSSREKVKRLSVFGREMGFDGEDELHSTSVSTLKFKLPRKIFSDSSTSVPRKLRSAIRKRSCESASVPLLDAKKSNDRVNNVQSLMGDSFKKSKICMKNGWSDHLSRRAVSVTISKDEEEVAETLFALAGMIPLDGVNNNRTHCESLEAKSSDLSGKQHSNFIPLSEDPMIQKEEEEATHPTSTTDSSARHSLKTSPMIDPEPPIWSKLSERSQLIPNLKVSVPLVHFQIPPLLRACDDRQLNNSTFCGLTEPNCESRLDDTKPEKFQLPKRESHINIGIADLAASQNREHSFSTECKNKASLTSRPLHGSGVGLPVQSSAMIFPSWLNNTSYEDTPSAGKVSLSVNGGRNSWRRCIAHVHISRLIQVLQTSEGKDIRPLDISQFRKSQCSPAGHVAGNGDDLNGTLAADNMFKSAAYMCKIANDVPVLHEKYQVKEEGPSVSGCCDSKKQSCNFLSLSTRVGPEVNKGVNRLGITLEAKGHALQLHSVAQRNTYMPCTMPQNCFPPIPYRDQVAAVSAAPPSVPPQVHLQVPPYFGNPCGPAHMGTARSTQQPHPKQQQQQQQIWTAQLAAQFRPGPLLSSHIAYPESLNHSQVHLPAPRPSLETIGSKYLHISQQQQQQQLFALCPSLPTSGAKLQNSQPPSICEDKGVRFHPEGVLPLQLLCNERL